MIEQGIIELLLTCLISYGLSCYAIMIFVFIVVYMDRTKREVGLTEHQAGYTFLTILFAPASVPLLAFYAIKD